MDKIKLYVFVDNPYVEIEQALTKEFPITKEDWKDREEFTFLNRALHETLIENGYDPDDKSYKYYRSYQITKNISGYEYF